MRKHLLPIIFLWPLSALCQNKEADSLRLLISESKEDDSKINLFRGIGETFMYSNPDSCYYYANQGLQLSRRLQNRREESLCLSMIGGTAAFGGSYLEALRIGLKSLQLAESTGDLQAIEAALNSLGTIYYFLNDFRNSIDYMERSLYMAQKMKKERCVARALTNIGDLYFKLNNPDSALYYSKLAYQKSKAVGYKMGIPDQLNNLGYVYAGGSNNLLGLQYFHLALPVEIETDDIDDLCQSTLGMAEIFYKQGKDDSALFYGYKSVAAALSSNFKGRQLEATRFIAGVYETDRRGDSAFKYLKLTIQLKDSLFSEEKSKAIQYMTFNENIRQQEITDEKKRADENAAKNLQLVAIAVFIPVFFLFVLFLRRKRVKARVVGFLAVMGLLLSFEFITDLIFPFISTWTNDSPAWETLILVIIAALVEPINYRLEAWINGRLVRGPG